MINDDMEYIVKIIAKHNVTISHFFFIRVSIPFDTFVRPFHRCADLAGRVKLAELFQLAKIV